jgi:hypothetical protein
LGKGVGVVLRFIYIFWVWGTWDSGFWRTVFLEFLILFWWKGVGVVVRFSFVLENYVYSFGEKGFWDLGGGGMGVVFLKKDSEYIFVLGLRF